MILLPLGSVIQIHKHKAIIIGYTSIDKAPTTTYGYLVVSYPIGFTSIEKAVFIPHDATFQILSEGYKTKASGALLATLSDSMDKAEAAAPEDILKLNQHLKNSTVSAKGEASE